MDEEKLKEKLLDWDQTLQGDIRKYHDTGDNEACQFALGCLCIVHQVLKEMEEIWES